MGCLLSVVETGQIKRRADESPVQGSDLLKTFMEDCGILISFPDRAEMAQSMESGIEASSSWLFFNSLGQTIEADSI